MRMITLEDLMNDISTDIVLETLTDVDALFEDSADILFDMLAEEGASMTELVMAKYIMHRYVGVLRDLIDDKFEIATLDVSCEDCCMCKE